MRISDWSSDVCSSDLQSFPEAVRAETLITKFPSDVKAFAKDHDGKIILKPLQGSGGQSVFMVGSENATNMNQMIEAINRDGYIIAQAYVPEAAKRTEARRVGKEWGSTGRSGWSPDH